MDVLYVSIAHVGSFVCMSFLCITFLLYTTFLLCVTCYTDLLLRIKNNKTYLFVGVFVLHIYLSKSAIVLNIDGENISLKKYSGSYSCGSKRSGHFPVNGPISGSVSYSLGK